MANESVQKNKNKNFYFALKCAAALTAAALVTAGVVALVAAKTGAATLGFAAVVASPVMPLVIGLIATVGILCCLPLLFVGGSSTSWFYSPRSSFFSPAYVRPAPVVYAPAPIVVGRPGPVIAGHSHYHAHSPSIFTPPSHPRGGHFPAPGQGARPGPVSSHFHAHRP